MHFLFLFYFSFKKENEEEEAKSAGAQIYKFIKNLTRQVQLILILWQKVRQTRIFAIVRVFPYYEEAKK